MIIIIYMIEVFSSRCHLFALITIDGFLFIFIVFFFLHFIYCIFYIFLLIYIYLYLLFYIHYILFVIYYFFYSLYLLISEINDSKSKNVMLLGTASQRFILEKKRREGVTLGFLEVTGVLESGSGKLALQLAIPLLRPLI